MILVTGATGTVGREVAKALAERAAPVRALIRTPEKATMFDGMPVEIAHGDLEDGVALAAALAGVSQVFLLTANPANQAELERGVIEAAREAGVEHVVKLSALNASEDSEVGFLALHRQAEGFIEESGMDWTHLRPNNFFQNVLFQAGTIREQGAFYGPFGDAVIASIDVRDVAAVAASVLIEPQNRGAVLELTGPVAIDHDEMGRVVSEATGRDVAYVNVSLEDARASMLGMGMPEHLAGDLTALYGQLAGGSGARVTSTVEEITGRTARSFSEFAHDYAAALSP